MTPGRPDDGASTGGEEDGREIGGGISRDVWTEISKGVGADVQCCSANRRKTEEEPISHGREFTEGRENHIVWSGDWAMRVEGESEVKIGAIRGQGCA